jgi:GNAT superfamily N-acetyltransferase
MPNLVVSTAGLRIRAATAADCALILEFIRELADYERLTQEVVASEEQLRKTLFGPHPAAEVIIAEQAGLPAGFALFFTNYSTFLARPGIYLEDLFVRPAFRRQGIGESVLVWLAALALERACGRLEWSVLDWNQPAIGFYRGLGAKPMDEWTVFRLSGAELVALAARSGPRENQA